jgi:hypothetical protein
MTRRGNRDDDDFEDEDDESWDADDEEGDDDSDDGDDDTIPCPYCGRQIYEDAVRCPKCERYLSDEDRTTTSKPRWVIVTAIIVLAAVAFAYLF